METFVYRLRGVCSREMRFEIDGDIIRNVTTVDGCVGNLLGISRIVRDKEMSEVLDALRGVCCGTKPTSRPDQITETLSEHARKLGQAGSLCLWHRAVKT